MMMENITTIDRIPYTNLDFLDLLRERAHHLVPRRLILPIEHVERQVLERNHEVVDKVEDLREGRKTDQECGMKA